jgi:dTMP kinase
VFITFEGPEGCGKSTQSVRLKSHLESQGQRVLLTREPGGTRMGRQIRDILLDPQSVLDETTEVYLFAADRSEHVSKIILPALAEEKVVISDRYIDSTLAYQIGGRGLPEDLVRYVNMISSRGLMPDLTFLLDVSPEEGLRRAKKGGEGDRFEREQSEFHQRVRAKYLEIAKGDPARVKLIETDKKGIDEIQEIVRRTVEEKLK